MDSNNKIKVIFIDGNISVGKSTIIRKLSEGRDDIVSLTEPIKKFTLLDKFNSHVIENDELKEILDYSFQLEVCVVIYNMIRKEITDPTKTYVVERNPYLRNIVFSADKNFGEEQRDTINYFNEMILKYMNEKFDYKTYFLDCDFEEKRKRLVERNKGNIPESYHKTVDENYRKYSDLINHETIINIDTEKTVKLIKI